MDISKRYENSWVICNLRKYSNSLVDKKMLKTFGIEKTREIFSEILKKKINFRVVDFRDPICGENTKSVKKRKILNILQK